MMYKKQGYMGIRISRTFFQASVLASAIVAVTYGSPSIGQEVNREVRSLEEVVVTARKREESIQDVPITINAFDEEFLRTRQINNFDDVQFYTPSMNISYNSGDTLEPIVAIRGVLPTEARLNDDPSAPIYYSDVVMTPSTGVNLSLYDIGNVQVLKGPQGTLFGRNSTAGAVLINPKRPGREFRGFVDVTLGNYDLAKTDFGIDVPVTDALSLRLSGRKTERDGYQTNKNDRPQPGPDVYNKEMWTDDTESLRISALWQPNDNLENLSILEWAKMDAIARAGKAVLTGRSIFDDSVDRNLELDDPFETRVNIVAPEEVEQTFFANTTEWQLGELTAKNILGYREVSSFRRLDLDGMDVGIVQSRYDGTGDSTDAEQFSEELQVLGTAFDDRLDWVVGAYYYLMDGTAEQNSASRVGTRESFDLKSESYALFGQGSYSFNDTWSLTLGLRQSWDEREISLNRYTGILTSPPNGTCALSNPEADCTLTGSDDFDSPTWDVSLSYNPSDSFMMYGTVGSGYKAGGFNGRASSAATLAPFDEETVVNYETGIKADWSIADWQFRTNFSVYYMDYEDIQVSVGDCIDLGGDVCSIITVKKNAAKAVYEGAEAEITVLPSDNLEFNLTYGFMDPGYEEWPDVDRSGNPIDRSDTIFFFQPEHEINASVTYRLPADPSLGDMALLANVLWRDQYSQTIDPVVIANPQWNDKVVQDAFHVIDVRFDWKSMMGSQFDLSLFVNNLDDETYVVSAADQMKDGRQLFHAHYYGEPRNYGASIRYNF